MVSFLFVIHFVVATALIIVILIQPGKGSTALGGGAQNFLDTATVSTFFTKITIFLGITLFITSLLIAVVAKKDLVQDNDVILQEQSSEIDVIDQVVEELPKLDEISPTTRK